MRFSEIIVQTVVSHPFEENTHIIHLNKNTDCFLIDPGFEPEKTVDFLERHQLTLSAMLITHGHADHIAGIEALKASFENCMLYIGEREADKLGDPHQNLSAPFGFPIVMPSADILLRDGETVDVAGIPVEVLHTPGHSGGHVVYLIRTEPKPILFAGDVLFRESIGRSDFPDGNHAELIESIRSKILTLPDDTVVYSGHGPTTTVGYERKHNPFLR